MKLRRKFFSPQMSASRCDQLNEGVNKLAKTSSLCNFFGGNVCVFHRGHLIYFRFMKAYQLFPGFSFYMYVFEHFVFWAPTRFPEAIRPRYSPDCHVKVCKDVYVRKEILIFIFINSCFFQRIYPRDPEAQRF